MLPHKWGKVPLVGTSARAFTPTFTSRNSIISTDFDTRADITINSGAGAGAKPIGITDLNGDGLPDMVVTDAAAKTLLTDRHVTGGTGLASECLLNI